MGIGVKEFTELADRHDVQSGRFRRYACSDIERLRRAVLAANSARQELAG
jgi:hypothetical protein